LKKQLKSCRNNLLKNINQKINNDKKVNRIKEEIEYYKKKIKMKDKYTSENIIDEDSSDNSQSIIINDNDNDNKPKNENIIKEQVIEKKNFFSNKKKFKYNRNNVDKIDFNTNNNNNMNEFKETINKKIIRSFSNKIIKRINFQNIKDNCNLYINFNFNVNNLNIINGVNNIKDNYKKIVNLTYNEKSDDE
jgi:hypothetical protein